MDHMLNANVEIASPFHHTPQDFRDKAALRIVKFMRFFAD